MCSRFSFVKGFVGILCNRSFCFVSFSRRSRTGEARQALSRSRRMRELYTCLCYEPDDGIIESFRFMIGLGRGLRVGRSARRFVNGSKFKATLAFSFCSNSSHLSSLTSSHSNKMNRPIKVLDFSRKRTRHLNDPNSEEPLSTFESLPEDIIPLIVEHVRDWAVTPSGPDWKFKREQARK